MNLIISILITFISYAIYPFIKYNVVCKEKKYTEKDIKKTLTINSIVIAMISLILGVSIYGNDYTPNFVPALFYYFINSFIFIKGEKTKQSNFKLTKTDMNKSQKIILIIVCIIFVLISILVIIQAIK